MADKILHAKAIISAEDRTGSTFAAIAGKMKGVERASKSLEKADRAFAGMKNFNSAAGSIASASEKLGKIEAFRSLQAMFIASRGAFNSAAENVRRLGAEMSKTATPTAQLERQYKGAQAAVSAAAAAFADKTAAIKSARAELANYGISLRSLAAHEAALSRSVGARRPSGAYNGAGPLAPLPLPGAAPAPVGGVFGIIPGGGPGVGAAAAAYAAARVHGAIVDKHHDYQQAYLYQQAVLGLSSEQQSPLLNQALKIGQDTKFTNADIVRAQTDIGGKLPKDLQSTATIAAITENTKNYALAMKVSMEEASTAMVGWMKSRGYDLSSPAAAERSSRRAANQMVEFAKVSGAKHHDLVGDTKFGAAPGRVGGFSEEYSNALSAQLIRLGYEGAMAGTFVRAAALKLSAPTSKSQAAIAATGLNFDDYVKPGTDLSVGGLGNMMKQRFGRALSKDQEDKLKEVFDNPDTLSDKGAFIEAASNILNESFARKKGDGKVNAQDAERIAKTLNEFHTLSAAGVDAERLMTDLIKKGLTPAQAKYLFGSEHGGRLLSLNGDQLDKDKKNFQNVPDNRAESVANKMQEGAQGEYTKLLGSVESLTTAFGEATDGARAFTYKGLGAFFDGLTWLVKGKPTEGIKTDRNADGSIFTSTNPLNDPALMEQARRRQDFVRRDPEAARGEAFAKMTAEVKTPVPVDVTGKVSLDPASKVDVNVSVKVQGPAAITGQSATASGNARGSVGTGAAGDY